MSVRQMCIDRLDPGGAVNKNQEGFKDNVQTSKTKPGVGWELLQEAFRLRAPSWLCTVGGSGMEWEGGGSDGQECGEQVRPH